MEFNADTAIANIHSVRPGMPIISLSAKTGDGMADWWRDIQVRFGLDSEIAANMSKNISPGIPTMPMEVGSMEFVEEKGMSSVT